MDMKRFFLYAIVIAALALAGCGSDGNGGTAVTPEPADPDPMPTAIDLSSLTAGMMLGAAGAQTIQPGMTYESGQVMFTCPAGGSACMVTVNADGTATYDANGGMPMVANTQAAMDAKDMADAALVAAATKAAGTKEMAIAAEAGQGPGQNPANPDAGLGGSNRVNADGTPDTADSPDAADDPYGLEISRDRDGTEVKITDLGMAGMDDPKFMQAMDLGGGTTMHVRTMEADAAGNVEEEVVVVTTDIEAPKAVAFAKFESDAAGMTPQALNGRKDSTDLPDDSNPADSLIIVNENLEHVSADSFSSSSGTGTINFKGATPAAGDTPAVEAETVRGTFNGAMGTYTCRGGSGGCTVTITDGKLSAIGSETQWVFTPDEGATSDQPDYDYLHYGFWLKKTTKDGETTYNEVETFAGSSLAASSGSELDTVSGSASYEGGATGVYVRNVNDAEGKHSATSGHFTADASLMVYFSGTSIAQDKHNTVTGTIDNFELSGGELNDWSVALDGARASGANMITGMAKGGGDEGTFSGTFYGTTPETPSTTDDATYRVAPGSVAGEFDANFKNGSVAGGFGARKQ